MMILTHFSTAIRQLLANKGKATLTMLGVIIGIGSVIAIMTLGEIAKNFLLSQITQFGTNIVEVAPGGSFQALGSNNDITLTDQDVEAIRNSSLLPEVEALAAGYTLNRQIEYKDKSFSALIYGDSPDIFKTNQLNIVKGRFFNSSDVQNATRVIVIEERVAEEAFGSIDDALGKNLSVGGSSLSVIGVVENLPSAGPFSGNTTFMPLSTVRNLFVDSEEQSTVQYLLIQFTSGTDAESFTNRVRYELYRTKGIEESNTTALIIASREQALEIFDTILIGIQMFIAAIAAISLFVGGIGIMNIMLVTVRERTKEIGLRKAVGAKNSSILYQFLIEAVVLTLVGGIIGIIGGLSVCVVAVIAVNAIQPDWGLSFVLVPSAIVLACAVSIGTGIVFGLYPAWKASRLHPIEALRYE